MSSASSPFMIYNKNHQLCVEVEAGKSLTAATCHPPSPTKLFRWVLGGRLLHVGSGSCVGVAQSASQRAVRLEPCDAQRPQQHWVCGEGGLLGLAGVTPPLYFNYGNSIRSVVMLYTGNKEWSRWVVYDSHRDLCSRACDGEFQAPAMSSQPQATAVPSTACAGPQTGCLGLGRPQDSAVGSW